MMNGKVIALDIGGVCLNLTFDRCLRYFEFEEQEIPLEILSAVDSMERGHTGVEDCVSTFRKYIKSPMSDAAIISGWNKILGEEMHGMANFVSELVENGYRCLFFSDTSEVHMNQVVRQLSFAHLITGGVFSYETGAKKPEERMYEVFEQKYGPPILYLDDKPENIEGGRKRDWNSHVFTDIDTCRKFFQKTVLDETRKSS